MKKEDCTILVCSCDTYEDAWYPFFKLFSEYWSDCPYDIILNTESKKFCYPGLDIKCFQKYKNKSVPYGKRLIEHLKEIKTDYVLVMLDDFFLRKKVDTNEINQYVDFLKNNKDVAVVSFDSVKDELNCADGKLEKFLLRPKYGEYKVNLQGAIWNREKLLNYVKANESPWEFEVKGTFRSFETEDKFYTLEDLSLTPMDYGKKKGLTWGIVRGKWVLDDVEPLFNKHNINIDLSERGIFDLTDYEDITVYKDESIRKNIESYGFKLWLKMTTFRVIKQIKRVLHMKYDADYITYKRRKNTKNYI